MWYSVDFLRFVVLNLPIGLRKPGYAALLQIFIKPLVTLHYAWGQWRKENIYKIEHTGQVCLLRKSLNDKFDVVERRIYIGNGQINETATIYLEAEQIDEYIGNEDEEDYLTLYTEAETGDTGYDFIVYVPEELFYSTLEALKAHVDFYKAAGKRYAILIINE